jgi:hypothetical protein
MKAITFHLSQALGRRTVSDRKTRIKKAYVRADGTRHFEDCSNHATSSGTHQLPEHGLRSTIRSPLLEGQEEICRLRPRASRRSRTAPGSSPHPIPLMHGCVSYRFPMAHSMSSTVIHHLLTTELPNLFIYHIPQDGGD